MGVPTGGGNEPTGVVEEAEGPYEEGAYPGKDELDWKVVSVPLAIRDASSNTDGVALQARSVHVQRLSDGTYWGC